MRVKISSDSIQLGILIVSGLCMLGAFWAYCEGHFAHADALSTEIQERREMKFEIDELYLRQIPESQQLPLKFRVNKDNKGISHGSDISP